MKSTATAVITVAHGRHHHLALQEAGLRRSSSKPDMRCLVAMNDPALVARAEASHVVRDCPVADSANLPLAAARNLGAREAIRRGAELLIFLDIDCVPSPTLVERYQRAHDQTHGIALLSGPATYLPPAPSNGYQLGALSAMADPHPARPNPASGKLLLSNDYRMFWSLSFAVGARTWQRLNGFHEEYVGYGGEDTDFAAAAEAARIPFYWVGGAHVYHQHHPISDPPVEHLHAIVRNARIFYRRWNRWPMIGWLDAFEELGLIERDADRVEILSRSKTGRLHGDSAAGLPGTRLE